MINNPKDIQEIINVIDNVTKEQLDEAIRRADEMNEEELKEAIEELKKATQDYHTMSENCLYFDEYQHTNLMNLTYKLENELKQEKEKNKKLLEEKEAFRKSYETVMEEKANDYFLMSKVIDMMATFIVYEDIYEMICKNVNECYRDNEDGDYFPCKACIKEYCFKKARGEKDND